MGNKDSQNELWVIKIADFMKNNMVIKKEILPEEFYYISLPLCIIDAVYSIGVRYESTHNTVIRFCEYYNLERISVTRKTGKYPPKNKQISVSTLIEEFKNKSIDFMVNDVFKNRQRTSPKNGILKAEAVLQFAIVLNKHNINYFQDVKQSYSEEIKNEIRKIPGQGKGISYDYFSMLIGNTNMVKTDRMVQKFLYRITGKKLSNEIIKQILDLTKIELQKEYPSITLREIDYLIWGFTRK